LREDGRGVAALEAELSAKALFINIRPQYYRKHLGYCYHQPWYVKPKSRAIAGWCSWEAYRRKIDMEKLERICAFMDEKLREYGLEYIQVDDGYQKMPLPCNPRGTMAEGWAACEESNFPRGHTGIVETISEKGFKPAIWTNANITNPDFVKHHPDAVLWFEGKPLKGEWIDFLYDCSPQTLERHVTPLFAKYTSLGYKYVKIDAIRHLLFDGLHECVRLGIMTNEDAQRRFRSYMEAARRGLGEEAYFLASWGEMHEVIGVADACRISMDANPTWAGIRMQLFESARWFHTQRILFLNDPDHVCVRTRPDWAKSVLSLISLSGQLYMLSDPVEAYTEEKLEIIRRTLPPLATVTAETGPLPLDYPAYTWTKLHGFAVQSHETPVETEEVSLEDALNMAGDFPTMHDAHPFSSLWAFHIRKKRRRWCVMARLATMPLGASKICMENLGLEPEKDYLAFDFWKQRFLGTVRLRMECEELSVGQCQIVALYEAKNEPQVIASSRHVSMDAISIKEHVFADGVLKLEICGVPRTEEKYYIHAPGKYEFKGVTALGAKASICEENGIYILRLVFTEKNASMELKFRVSETGDQG